MKIFDVLEQRENECGFEEYVIQRQTVSNI